MKRAGLAVMLGAACAAAHAGDAVYVTRSGASLPVYSNQPLHEGSALVATLPRATRVRAVTGRRTPSAVARAAEAGLDGIVKLAARTHDVEEALLLAVIEVESNFNPAARSVAGARGLMQLMPETARRYGVLDLHDPAQNVDAGSRYLRDLLDRFGGDLRLVLAAYNAGEGAVARYGNRVPPFAETQQYVPAVLARYRDWRARASS